MKTNNNAKQNFLILSGALIITIICALIFSDVIDLRMASADMSYQANPAILRQIKNEQILFDDNLNRLSETQAIRADIESALATIIAKESLEQSVVCGNQLSLAGLKLMATDPDNLEEINRLKKSKLQATSGVCAFQ